MLDIHPVVRSKAAKLGVTGERWLADLPATIAELERRWACTVGAPIAGGTDAYVAHARLADGTAAVLKLAVPDGDGRDEIRTLRLADGNGYVRLLAYDAERFAMLQEALGPSMADLSLSPEQQIDALCATFRQAWAIPTGAVTVPPYDKAVLLAEMIEQFWAELGRPCARPIVDKALAYAERRAAAYDPARCVVVHGDPHPGNTLRVPSPRAGAESGFVFVDPDGYLADPTYDLGLVLRSWCREVLAAGDAPALVEAYCARLADRTGLDARAIWEWGYIEQVSTGLYALRHGADEPGRAHLATAGLLVAATGPVRG